MQLEFEIGGERWPILCDETRAPRTLARLARHLPMGLQLHTPKIAGSHVYWHAPFVEDAEGPVDVLDAAPGAFIYWPVRQFLELVFAPLQAETAAITVLGHLGSGVDRLMALGAALREGHGRRPFDGVLRRPGASPSAAEVGPVPAPLAAELAGLWRACPAEIADLARSRAIMHPAGPVFTAEAEARVLHETLFELRALALAGGGGREEAVRFAAGVALSRAGGRLNDFCHLRETGRLLAALSRRFADPAPPLTPLFEDAILASGRIAAWIDLQIPWSALNEAMRAALPAPPRPLLEPQPGE